MAERLTTEHATSPCDDEAPSIRSLCPSWVAGRLIVLLAVSIIVRVTDPVGWLGSDDASYHSAAEHVLHGEPTHRVHHHLARAPERLVTVRTWDGEQPIFVALSLYWRYRILFPENLRARLHVAVDPDAPTWWRGVTMDIASREAPLPPPEEAHLVVTPTQLTRERHFGDYGVALPRDRLAAWQSKEPVTSLCRLRDGTVAARRAPVDDADRGKEVLLLLGGEAGLALRNGSNMTPTAH